jgi:hypothetical protein
LGSLESRLTRLEDRSRERAAVQIARAWAGLTDKEIALMLAPYVDGIREPTPEQREVEERMRAATPEELIHKAIGFEEDMGQEEVNRRISKLVDRLGIFERSAGIRRHLHSSKGG